MGIFFCGAIPAKGDAPGLQTPELVPYLVNDFSIHNQNWSIAQSPESNFIYLANSDGLYEYDGIRWKNYQLRDNMSIRSVAAHKNGMIFTGAFEEFGYWIYDDSGSLEYQSLTELTHTEKNDEIWKIYIHNNKVYFQSFTSVYIYDFETIEKVKSPYTMLFLHQVDGQFISQIIDSGLFSFEEGTFEKIENSSLFSNKKVHAIIPYTHNTWMVCTESDGIYLYDKHSFSYFESEASDFLSRYTCNAALQINDTLFAFGSILNGIILTNERGEIMRSYNTNNGLKNNTVLSLFLDNNNGLWAGLDQGVNFIDLLSPFTHYKSRNGTVGTIYALLQHNEKLYIGTNHGLFRADINKKAPYFNINNLDLIPNSHGQVWTLDVFDNQVFCGHNNGTFVIKNGRMHQISSVTGGWSFNQRDDYIMGGTYTGIVFFHKNDQDDWEFSHKVEGFSEPTRRLETDYLGYIWASHHQKGIFKIELCEDLRQAKNVVHYHGIGDHHFNIRVFKINNRVVFTTSEDIFTFDFVRNKIVPFETLSQSLGPFKDATQITRLENNLYWFFKGDKIALFEIGMDFSAKKLREIHQESIKLPQRNIQMIALDDETLLIPNPDSFDAYSLSDKFRQEKESKLGMEKLLFYGTKDSTVFFRSFSDVNAPWDSNNLKVYFSDPACFELTNKHYQYRIKELSPVWQSTTENHFTYLDLQHGSYTVQIRDDRGAMIEKSFSIGKPWYYSHLAMVIYSLAIVALILGGIRFFRFEVNRHKELVSMEMRQNNLEKELDYKSYELMLTMRHLILKDDILNDLQKQIQSIKEQASKYPVKHIKNMEKIIKQGVGTQNVEWENALNNLKLTQQGFFKVLKEKYPELTPHDLRLCSYLRLNFNTKEIARLLNISPRAVEISRHRIRKKLHLHKNENLFEFLLNEELNTQPTQNN